MNNAVESSILRKVQRLLALAKGATGEEAENAMRHATAMIDRYRLDSSQLEEREFQRLKVWTGKRAPYYAEDLIYVMYRLCFSRAIYTKTYDHETRAFVRSVVVYGRPENLAVADYCWAVLERQIKALVARDKPRSKKTYVSAMMVEWLHKMTADQRGVGSRSDTKDLIRNELALLNAAFESEMSGAKEKRTTVVDPVFPQTDLEKVLCACLLDFVTSQPSLKEDEYVDLMILAMQPANCRLLLTGDDRDRFDHALTAVLSELVADSDGKPPWRLLLSTLRANQSIQSDRFAPGPNALIVRGKLPVVDGQFVAMVLKAGERLRELQDAATPDPASARLVNLVRHHRTAAMTGAT